MKQQEAFYFVAFVFLVLPSHIHSGHFGDYKVLISKGGPTKLGEITAFDAEVVLKPEAQTRHTANENIIYEFSWKVSSEQWWIKRNKTTHRWDSFPWRWNSGGQKRVSVYVRILVSGGRVSGDERRYGHSGYNTYMYYAMNHTDVIVIEADGNNKIIATLSAYQDSSEIYNTGNSMLAETFNAGVVHLEVKIVKPQDLDNITCDWNFGDGSPKLHNNSQLKLSHNFTTVAPSTVNVTVHGLSQGRYYVGSASKTLKFEGNKIVATLSAYQDSSEIYNTGNSMLAETFNAGVIHLEVKIDKPQDLDNITCDWNFGDGSPKLHNSQLKLSHNFTTVAPSTVNVTVHGLSQGRNCVGSASKTLEFKANVHAHLEIKSSAGPKLPPGHPNSIAMDSPVTFEVKFNDPFKVITSISGIDWKFGDGHVVSKSKNTTMLHTYHKEGSYSLWVTIRVNTKYQRKNMHLDPINKNLYVKAPVSLAVQHKHAAKDKIVTFNISCNGSLPVSFHWCVLKQCNLLPGEICSPMMEHKNSCSLIVKHTFRDSGKYCVNVGVMNDVSGTNTSLMVQIPGDLPGPKHSTSRITAGVLVPIFIVCFLLVFIIFIVRKMIYSRRKKSERADFDFRDDDTSSLSSVDLYGRQSCFPRCGIWGSCKKQEIVPLLIQAADYKMYTL